MIAKKRLYEAIVISLLVVGASAISALGAISDDQQGEPTIQLSVEQPAFSFISMDTSEGAFSLITVEDQGYTTTVGEAQLPMIRYMVEIPQGAVPELVITYAEWDETSLDTLDLPPMIVPVQPSVVKTAIGTLTTGAVNRSIPGTCSARTAPAKSPTLSTVPPTRWPWPRLYGQ